MVKFAVGYQLAEKGEEPFVNIVKDFHKSIEEVYFPWLDISTCRASLTNRRGYVEWKAQEKLEEDLKVFKKMNIRINLLLNANCYGKDAVSNYLLNLVCSTVEHIIDVAGSLDIVTTTSPAIAYIIKQNFKDIDTCASVNMRIGTVKGIEYISDLFDIFCIQRELNRDLNKIKELVECVNKKNKILYLLSNSGCLNYCSGQIFHDNLVAHEIEVDEIEKIPNWNPHTCWRYYEDKKNWTNILQGSWIRPEDVHHYESYFKVIKLATRMHSDPKIVIKAYSGSKYEGNLLDLFEPGFGQLLSPFIIDNSRFPSDWFKKTTTCDKKCHICNYCDDVLKKVLTS